MQTILVRRIVSAIISWLPIDLYFHSHHRGTRTSLTAVDCWMRHHTNQRKPLLRANERPTCSTTRLQINWKLVGRNAFINTMFFHRFSMLPLLPREELQFRQATPSVRSFSLLILRRLYSRVDVLVGKEKNILHNLTLSKRMLMKGEETRRCDIISYKSGKVTVWCEIVDISISLLDLYGISRFTSWYGDNANTPWRHPQHTVLLRATI